MGLAPMAGEGGGGEGAGVEDGATNCAKPISSANLLIERPPAPPFPDEFPVPAAAIGAVLVDAVPAAMGRVAVVDDGATLMVARGAVGPALLNDNGSVV